MSPIVFLAHPVSGRERVGVSAGSESAEHSLALADDAVEGVVAGGLVPLEVDPGALGSEPALFALPGVEELGEGGIGHAGKMLDFNNINIPAAFSK